MECFGRGIQWRIQGNHGKYGMMVDNVTLIDPINGIATVAVYKNSEYNRCMGQRHYAFMGYHCLPSKLPASDQERQLRIMSMTQPPTIKRTGGADAT